MLKTTIQWPTHTATCTICKLDEVSNGFIKELSAVVMCYKIPQFQEIVFKVKAVKPLYDSHQVSHFHITGFCGAWLVCSFHVESRLGCLVSGLCQTL